MRRDGDGGCADWWLDGAVRPAGVPHQSLVPSHHMPSSRCGCDRRRIDATIGMAAQALAWRDDDVGVRVHGGWRAGLLTVDSCGSDTGSNAVWTAQLAQCVWLAGGAESGRWVVTAAAALAWCSREAAPSTANRAGLSGRTSAHTVRSLLCAVSAGSGAVCRSGGGSGGCESHRARLQVAGSPPVTSVGLWWGDATCSGLWQLTPLAIRLTGHSGSRQPRTSPVAVAATDSPTPSPRLRRPVSAATRPGGPLRPGGCTCCANVPAAAHITLGSVPNRATGGQ